MTQESYEDKLRRHSYESRIDPLRDAARRLLAVWDAEDDLEKQDLSEELWRAVQGLRTALTSVRRGGEEDVPEVEVTESSFRAAHEDAGERSPLPVESPEMPVAARRSAAKNVSAPEYQNAFISEARHSMGQPTKEDAEALLGRYVVLTFNAEMRGGITQARGHLTQVIDHPASGGYSPYLILDDDKKLTFALIAIQSIAVVP